MSHILGVYWAPGHMRQGDLDYLAQLQPPAIRILDGDAETMNRAHRAAPNALLLPRDWALSEQHDDVSRDPIGAGIRHAQEWRAKLDTWRQQGMTVPDSQIVVVGINEPRVWWFLPQVVEYTVAFLNACAHHGLRACALNLSVGWPANNGPDTPPDWTPYAPIEAAIRRGQHVLVVHEYWYRSGPQDGATWWAWRINRCPWDVPVIIGECGIDNQVDAERWHNEGQPPRGWQGNVSPDQYADQMVRYVRGLDARVVAVLPFLTDYRAREWQSFDTEPAHAAFLARRNEMVPEGVRPYTVYLPHVPNQSGTDPNANWVRSYPHVLRIEGGLSTDPNDPGNWRDGKLVGTKYGISAAVWGGQYDIPNLTEAQALDIYRQHYWRAAGCENLPWPLCLVAFDTAVNHGVGVAQEILGQHSDPVDYLAHRMLVYVRLANWARYGTAWGNRVKALLDVVRAT